MELYYPKDQVNIICLLIYEVDKVDKCHPFGTSIEQKKIIRYLYMYISENSTQFEKYIFCSYGGCELQNRKLAPEALLIL